MTKIQQLRLRLANVNFDLRQIIYELGNELTLRQLGLEALQIVHDSGPCLVTITENMDPVQWAAEELIATRRELEDMRTAYMRITKT